MRLRFAAAALLLALSTGAAAQQAPPRPSLPRDADPNDWEAYFDYGARVLTQEPRTAEAAFYWASRLAPNRAEPLFGRWAAYWYYWDGRFMAYLNDEMRPAELREAARVDSLRYRAMVRNPFVQRDLILLAYQHLPGEWSSDPATQAMLASARQDYPRALAILGNAAARDPRRYWLHEQRALAFAALGRLDSATVEMEAMLSGQRQAEDRRMVRLYESKAMGEYGLGLLYMARHRYDPAREAFARALAEDLSFAPAHSMLGAVAMAQQDTATGLREYRQALELAPDDGALRAEFGQALLGAGQAAQAVEELRRAIALEPDYPEARLVLAQALDQAGDRTGAAAAFREYLARAPRRAAADRAEAARRLQALEGAPSPSPD